MAWREQAGVLPCSGLSLISIVHNSGERIERPQGLMHLMNRLPMCSTACIQWWVQLGAAQGKAWVHISRNEHAAGRVLMLHLIVFSHSLVLVDANIVWQPAHVPQQIASWEQQ